MNITNKDIKVKIKISEKPTMLAQAEVIFFDKIETKGWRVMPSQKVHPRFQDQLWIQPPSYRAGIKYHPTVWLNDTDLYDMVEELIYNAYNDIKAFVPTTPPEAVVNIDEIPI